MSFYRGKMDYFPKVLLKNAEYQLVESPSRERQGGGIRSREEAGFGIVRHVLCFICCPDGQGKSEENGAIRRGR
jgi:hypothetical protein